MYTDLNFDVISATRIDVLSHQNVFVKKALPDFSVSSFDGSYYYLIINVNDGLPNFSEWCHPITVIDGCLDL